MRSEDLKNKRVAVIGLGPRTGVSLTRFLAARGAKVIAYDRKPKEKLATHLSVLNGASYELELGTDMPSKIFAADLFLVSPGVPTDSPFLVRARKEGKIVESEVEFASRFLTCPMYAVTGTNGKSTTTSLVAHILTNDGKTVFSGGNLGKPLIDAVGGNWDAAVVEVSSFQLENIETFHPKVAVLTNLSPNHIDRHGSFEAYVACKERIFTNMKSSDRAIVNGDDTVCRSIGERVHAGVWFFSSNTKGRSDIRDLGTKMQLPGDREISFSNFKLRGAHNRQNAMAAAGAALAAGCSIESIQKGMDSYGGLPHRLESVGTIEGVEYVNDSKSTTPDSTIVALNAFERGVILLAGGRSKGTPYDKLAEIAQKKTEKTFLFGECAPVMAKAFANSPHVQVKTLEEAFSKAKEMAQSGDVVLLSPANASFDQFSDYEERGRRFTELVLSETKREQIAGEKK